MQQTNIPQSYFGNEVALGYGDKYPHNRVNFTMTREGEQAELRGKQQLQPSDSTWCSALHAHRTPGCFPYWYGGPYPQLEKWWPVNTEELVIKRDPSWRIQKHKERSEQNQLPQAYGVRPQWLDGMNPFCLNNWTTATTAADQHLTGIRQQRIEPGYIWDRTQLRTAIIHEAASVRNSLQFFQKVERILNLVIIPGQII